MPRRERGRSKYAQVMRMFEANRNNPDALRLVSPDVLLGSIGYEYAVSVSGHFPGVIDVSVNGYAGFTMHEQDVSAEVADTPGMDNPRFSVQTTLTVTSDVDTLEAGMSPDMPLTATYNDDTTLAMVITNEDAEPRLLTVPPFDYSVLITWQRMYYRNTGA